MEKKHPLPSLRAREDLQMILEQKDRRALWVYIKEVFGIKIPRNAVCEDHDAPFDFIADAFFCEYSKIIAIGNRSGGKTLDFAILDTLNSFCFDNCEIATVGAIQDQALKCYSYVQNFVMNIKVFADNLISSLLSKTLFKNGSMVQILTGTMKGVNGPHPQKVFIDEVELILWQILQEAFSMAQSKGAIKSQTILTSTRKFAFGPMERLLREANKRGFRTYRWCILETIEPHDALTCATTRYGQEDCLQRCQLSDGYYSFDDAVSEKDLLDEETWESQWRSGRPSAQGLIYPQFNDILNIIPTTPDLGAELYLAEDFGFAKGHADVVGFFQMLPSGKKIMLDEIWVEGKMSAEIIQLVCHKLIDLGFVSEEWREGLIPGVPLTIAQKAEFGSKVTAWACPVEEPSLIAERMQNGFRVVAQADPALRRISYGIPLLRKDLSNQTLVFDPKCTGTTGEMRIYSNKKLADGTFLDEPNKVNDNGPDMVRYFYINFAPAEVAGSLSEANRDSVGTHADSDDGMITSGIGDMVF